MRFLGVSGRSSRCAGSHVCAHLCLACPPIPGVSVSTCPYILCPLSLYLGTVVLGVSTAGTSTGLSLPPPESLLLSSSLPLGFTDPSRRLIAGTVTAIFSSSAPLPSPTQTCWGNRVVDRPNLGSLTGWGAGQVRPFPLSLTRPWWQGEPGSTTGGGSTLWGRLIFLLLTHGGRKSQASLPLPPPSP